MLIHDEDGRIPTEKVRKEVPSQRCLQTMWSCVEVMKLI